MADPENTNHNYEEQFANRFSEGDHEYQVYVKRSTNPPPIVEDWSRGRGGGNSRGRDTRYQGHRGHRGRGWGGERHRDRDDDRGRERDWGGEPREHQDRERCWGQGSRPQSGPQGYNSYNQRPHYDRY